MRQHDRNKRLTPDTFVAEMVGDRDLPNAVALNSTSFNAAQMIGPALAGLLIARVGIGWAFLLNGLSFGAVLISMTCRSSRAPEGNFPRLP